MRIRLGLICALAGMLPAMAQHSGKALSRQEAKEMKEKLVAEWKKERAATYRDVAATRVIKAGDRKMMIWSHTFGEEPLDGRSLYISMHGGGGAPKEVNDQQWGNQCNLYRPAEGVYVCPRAPQDAWDMWHQSMLDTLLHNTIEYFTLTEHVNPNKVYLMGYSAGGDGVWRLAPRMADSWAAASMMAGHPGETSLLSLRNLPYSIWCGGDDAAYDRNVLNYMCGQELDSLRKDDPHGYLHETHIMEGMGHWMMQADTVAVSWMSQYVRNPYPDRIVWAQGAVPHHAFYWVSVPPADYKEYTELRVERRGNTITILESDYPEVTLWLNDEMVNLDKKVKVVYKGKVLWKGKVPRTEANLRESLWNRGDAWYAFPGKITIIPADPPTP